MIKTTKEDIAFLKDLQHELNTQETDCQADPRFWVINETKRTWGFENGYADDVVACNCNGDSWETPEEFLNYLIHNDYLSREQINEEYDYDFDEILTILGNSDFFTCGYKDEDTIVPDTLFLTKRACQEHINRNSYHYDHPHTYAMTAWRSPEFEKFMTLFKSADLDKLKIEDK